MHQLWRHPNGTFYVLYGPRLKRRISTRSRERRAAEGFLAQFIAGAEDPIIESPTVLQILEAYRDDRLADVRSKETLKYSVAALAARLGGIKPEHLTPIAIKRYARERGAADGTVLREIGTLRAALAWAVEHRWLATQPIISNPVKSPPPRDRWITKEEARLLLSGCREPHVRLFVMLGLMTVARMGAILEAKWCQVDWDKATIDYGPGHGKKRRAIVPLNHDVLQALKAAKELACSDSIVEFHGRALKTIKKGFREACKRAGLSGVTPHILRHSGATWMIADGVPLSEVARMLGDTESTVERVYAKHAPGYLARAASALQLGPRAA